MHSAPSVNYPVGRSRHAGRMMWTLWFCGFGVVALAWVQSAGTGWRDGVLLLCVALAAFGVWAGTLHSQGAHLVFDGQYWLLSGGVPMARAAVMLDLQALLLIRLTEPLGTVRWIWAERRAMPERWRDLRRALYSRPVSVEAVDAPHSSS